MCGDRCGGLKSTTVGAYFIITVSSFIIIFSFLGCCGAWWEDRCMLAIFFTVNFFLFAAMVGGSVLAYSGEDNIKTTFDMALEAYNDQPEDKNLKEYKKVWNEVQNEVEF